jgi:hypothetical protein
MADRSPRAYRSIGASAKTSVNWNSAMALPNIEKSIAAPAFISGNCSPNSARYAGDAFSFASSACRIGSLRNPLASGAGTESPPSSNWSNLDPRVPAVPVNPATSTSSVGGIWGLCSEQCPEDRVVWWEGAHPLRRGKHKTLRVVEWVIRGGKKASVPHQIWEERCVDDGWRATLVARPAPVLADDVVVLNTDRN